MRSKNTVLSLLLLLAVTFSVTSATYYSKTDGNWGSSSTWNPSGVPNKTDEVVIRHTVTLTSNEDVKFLEITSAGVLQGNYVLQFWNNGSLKVDGTMSIKTIDLKNVGILFTVNASGEIILSGDLDVNNNNITCNGNIEVGGTLTCGNITGAGSVTADVYNTGTVYGITPVAGITYYGQSWVGGTTGNENSWETSTNWASGSVPTSSSLVKINAGSTVPIISSNAVCNDLLIESSASLVIHPLSSLTINGNVTNTGTIILKSDASGTGSLIDNGSLTNNGTIKVERYLTSGAYHYISSPINNVSTSAFAGSTIYAYDETNSDTNRNYGWTAVSTSSGTLTNGRGYAVYHTTNATDTLSGNFNSGNISVTATRTNSGSSASPSPDGWNILGNPYPSAISASSFLSANSDLTGTLYLWADDGTAGSGFTTADYGTYTAAGGVGASGGGQSTAPDGKIAVGQGFFVQVKSGISSTNVSFTNSMRQTNTTQFFIPKSEVQSFRLDLSDQAGNQNEILVSFINDATKGFDQYYDGVKIQGNPYLSLYTIMKDYELIIQALPYMQEDVQIALGYYAAASGEYNFERFEFTNFGDDVRVFLEDKKSGEFIDLLSYPKYTFTTEGGKFNDRFILHFKKKAQVNPSEDFQSQLDVYAVSSSIFVKNPAMKTGLMTVYNLAGEKIRVMQFSDDNVQNLHVNLAAGIYLISVENDQEKITKKVSLK